MPSHSLRICWCDSDRGHKGSAQSRVQLRPKAAANPEHGADFPVNGVDFWAENCPNKGWKKLTVSWADFTCSLGGNFREEFFYV